MLIIILMVTTKKLPKSIWEWDENSKKKLQNMHSTSSRKWCLIPSTTISSQLQYKLTQLVASKEQKGKEQRERKKNNFTMNKPGEHFLGQVIKDQFSLVAQLCPTLCDLMDYSTPSFPVIINIQSLLKPMSIELVMPSNHLILCRLLLLLPSIFPSIRVFS